jgi:hypothetical protein
VDEDAIELRGSDWSDFSVLLWLDFEDVVFLEEEEEDFRETEAFAFETGCADAPVGFSVEDAGAVSEEAGTGA